MAFPGATEFTYAQGGGTINYGCLNGDYMSVYIDQYGDLGLRTFAAGFPVSRVPGVVDPDTGYPDDNISTNGQIIPTANPPTYCILRSLTGRNVELNTVTAVKGRRELVSAGGGSVCACWGVFGDHADLSPGGSGVVGIDGDPTAFSVAGTNSTDILSADATVMLYDSTPIDLLEVRHLYSFQNDASALEQVRITVEVELRNASGADLTNVHYGFCIDPNPGFTTGVATVRFLSSTDAEAFGVEGTVGDWNVGLGVYTAEGSIFGYTTENRETVLPREFDLAIAASPNIRLGSGTNAEEYSGNVLQASTTNWKTDTVWRSGLPTANGTHAIFFRSPLFDIDSGDTHTLTFYIFTRPIIAAAAVGPRVWAYA